MPTAGRAAGAVLFAALIWVVSDLVKPLLPEGMDPGLLSEVNALIAFIVAYVFWGKRSGEGPVAAIGYGLTCGVLTAGWALFLQSFGEMIRRSLRKQYDGATEAVIAVFELMVEFGQLLLDQRVLIALIGGSIFAGLLTDAVGRRLS